METCCWVKLSVEQTKPMPMCEPLMRSHRKGGRKNALICTETVNMQTEPQILTTNIIIKLYTRCLKHPMIKSRCLICGLTCDGFAEWLFRVSLQKVLLHVVQGLHQNIKWLLVASSNILVLLYGPASTSGKRCYHCYNKQKVQDILNPTPLQERLIHMAPEEHIFQGSNSSSWSLQGLSESTPPKTNVAAEAKLPVNWHGTPPWIFWKKLTNF